MIKRAPTPVPLPAPQRQARVIRLPERPVAIHIQDRFTVEYTSDTVTIWGAALIGISSALGYREFIPWAVSGSGQTLPWHGSGGSLKRVTISWLAADFRLKCGNIKVLVSPYNRTVQIWNAKCVEIVQGDGSRQRLYEERRPEPEFTDSDLFGGG